MNNIEFDIEKFSKEVDNLCSFDVGYLEAIINWCSKNNFEIETIISIVKKHSEIKNKLFLDATKKNLLKKE